MVTHWTCQRITDGDANFRTNLEGSEGDSKKGKIWISSRTERDSIQSVHNMPTATSQIMDTFKSSLDEGKDAIMLPGGRKTYHSKKKDAKDITQFRTISPLNVEGTICFSVLAKRLTKFMTDNNYVDTSVQNGGILGFSGCIMHTSALSQLIREARIRKGDLKVDWVGFSQCIRLYTTLVKLV